MKKNILAVIAMGLFSVMAFATEGSNDWFVLKEDSTISLQHKYNKRFTLEYYCSSGSYQALKLGLIDYISFPDSHDIRESIKNKYSESIYDKDLIKRILSVDEIKLYSLKNHDSTFDVILFDVANVNAAIRKYQPVIDECVNREPEKEMAETGLSQERLYNVEVLSISVVLLLTMALILLGVSYLAKKAAKAKRD